MIHILSHCTHPSHRLYEPTQRLPRGADLDDTLLQTTDSDTSAMEEVAAKLSETYPNVSWDDILGTWTAAFKDAPWDASHQVHMRLSANGF